jgi:FAD/FMN-containing dehydrogenase
MVCDNLLSVDVVMADGRFLTASASENADLFWGLRGGGGNFGVATSFEYKLHRLPQVYGGPLVFPLEQAARVLERFREVAESAPDELTLLAGVPIPDAGPVMGVVVAYVGPEEEGKRVTKPLRDLGPVMDGAAPTPYTKLQQTFDAAYPKGQRTYWKSAYLKELPNDLISRAVEMAINAPAKSHLVIEQAGGAIARVPAGETAFEHRGAKFNILAVGLGTEPSEDQANIEWARKLWAMAQPHSTGGAYVNYLGEGETVSPAYGSQTYRRLAELKKKYDPGNFFRLNQNIQPGH